MKNQKKLKFALKFLVSAGFVSWLIYAVKWNEVLFYLEEVRFWQILIYLIVLFTGFTISSYKWQFLAEFKGIKLPLKKFLSYYITGTFINNFMPSFVAGDAYKAYAIGKKDQRYAQSASTVMMDRFTGFVGAGILSFIFSLINIKTVLEYNILIFFNIGILIFLCTDFIILAMKKIAFMKKLIIKLVPDKILDFFRELGSYNNNSAIIKRSIIWAMIFSLIGVALLNYILFLSLGIKISPINYLSVIFLATIISSLPISINNIGIKEWSYITFFGLFGVEASAVVTVAIISRLLQMLVSFIGLPVYLREKK